MPSPCAFAPSSSRYAIASAVTAGCRRVNTSASRCARSLDHDAIAFQASTNVGRSVMTAHALVAARRITRQRRRGGAQRARMCRQPFLAAAEDVHVFVTLDALVRRARPGACTRGMRIRVSVVVGQSPHGASFDEVLAGYPDLEREDVEQALRYAAWLAREQVQLVGPYWLHYDPISCAAGRVAIQGSARRRGPRRRHGPALSGARRRAADPCPPEIGEHVRRR